jgi:hypothetical protein
MQELSPGLPASYSDAYASPDDLTARALDRFDVRLLHGRHIGGKLR